MYSLSKSWRACRTALHSATMRSRRSSRVHEESAISAAPLMMLSKRSSREGRKRASLNVRGSKMILFCWEKRQVQRQSTGRSGPNMTNGGSNRKAVSYKISSVIKCVKCLSTFYQNNLVLKDISICLLQVVLAWNQSYDFVKILWSNTTANLRKHLTACH